VTTWILLTTRDTHTRFTLCVAGSGTEQAEKRHKLS